MAVNNDVPVLRKEELITINIKLENLEKDLYNNVYRIDKILTESFPPQKL